MEPRAASGRGGRREDGAVMRAGRIGVRGKRRGCGWEEDGFVDDWWRDFLRGEKPVAEGFSGGLPELFRVECRG